MHGAMQCVAIMLACVFVWWVADIPPGVILIVGTGLCILVLRPIWSKRNTRAHTATHTDMNTDMKTNMNMKTNVTMKTNMTAKTHMTAKTNMTAKTHAEYRAAARHTTPPTKKSPDQLTRRTDIARVGHHQSTPANQNGLPGAECAARLSLTMYIPANTSPEFVHPKYLPAVAATGQQALYGTLDRTLLYMSRQNPDTFQACTDAVLAYAGTYEPDYLAQRQVRSAPHTTPISLLAPRPASEVVPAPVSAHLYSVLPFCGDGGSAICQLCRHPHRI